MIFAKAIEIAEKNKHLIGKEYLGRTIDEIIIFPTNPEMQKEFHKQYVYSLNAQSSIIPYLDSDVEVGIVVDKQSIYKMNLFIHSALSELKDTFEILE